MKKEILITLIIFVSVLLILIILRQRKKLTEMKNKIVSSMDSGTIPAILINKGVKDYYYGSGVLVNFNKEYTEKPCVRIEFEDPNENIYNIQPYSVTNTGFRIIAWSNVLGVHSPVGEWHSKIIF